MLLRWLVSNWLQGAAGQKARATVQDVLQSHLRGGKSVGGSPDNGEPPPPPPPCDIAFILALDIEAGGLVDLLQNHVRSRCATFR